MNNEKLTCPVCRGKKVVAGRCVCNMEWRGTMINDVLEDCQCSHEETCTNCNGTGLVERGHRHSAVTTP